MKAQSFRVAWLPSCYHTPETVEIFERCVDGSITEFVTSALLEYAVKLGFCGHDVGQPSYIGNERFVKIQEIIAKSKKTDYTYLIAFEYLLHLRPGVSKSNIYRDAIKNFC